MDVNRSGKLGFGAAAGLTTERSGFTWRQNAKASNAISPNKRFEEPPQCGYLRVLKSRWQFDQHGYTSDDTVVEGEIEAGKIYEESDFNRSIEIREREKKRVQIFMDQINPNEKTLVFCANQAHALLVRDLINQTKTSKDPMCVPKRRFG